MDESTEIHADGGPRPEPVGTVTPTAYHDAVETREGSCPPRRIAGSRTPTLGRTPISTMVAAVWDRPRVLVATVATLVAMPLLLVGISIGTPQRTTYRLDTAAASYRVAPVTVSSSTSVVTGGTPSGTAAPESTPAVPVDTTSTTTETSTSTSTSSTPDATSTTAAPESTTSTTVWVATTTVPPTTAPPTTAPPTTAAPAASSGRSESGLATWYDRVGLYGRTPGGCASRTVPKGTTVRITASNGRSTTCLVDDYGPFGAGRIIDLSVETFSQLASLGTGVISVTVTW